MLRCVYITSTSEIVLIQTKDMLYSKMEVVKMFATTGIIQENTVLTDDYTLAK